MSRNIFLLDIILIIYLIQVRVKDLWTKAHSYPNSCGGRNTAASPRSHLIKWSCQCCKDICFTKTIDDIKEWPGYEWFYLRKTKWAKLEHLLEIWSKPCTAGKPSNTRKTMALLTLLTRFTKYKYKFHIFTCSASHSDKRHTQTFCRLILGGLTKLSGRHNSTRSSNGGNAIRGSFNSYLEETQ